MDQQLWMRAKEIFHELADLSSAEKVQKLEALALENSLHELVLTLLKGDESSQTPTQDWQILTPEEPVPVFGSYRIIGEIGRGGMGTVYEALRVGEDFEQKVALKVIQMPREGASQFEVRFRKERQILSRLEHPNIARFLDGGTSPMGSFFAMEFIDGETLLRFADQRKLRIKDRVKLFLQLCSAVQFAHTHLIVHRDLKPSNVMVTQEGQVKLLDFGIAKILAGEESSPFESHQTETGFAPMTPQYASPEQFLNLPITTATDVYGLGLVLYELLTGFRAYNFKDRSLREMDAAIVRDLPMNPSQKFKTELSSDSTGETSQLVLARNGAAQQIISELNGDLDAIVMKALRKEPERRYAGVSAFSDDLERFLNGLPVAAHPDSLSYRLKKRFKRYWFEISAAGLVAILLIALASVSLLSAQKLARKNKETALQRDKAESVSQFLIDLFDSASPYGEQGAGLSAIDLVRLGSPQIESKFENQPDFKAELQSLLSHLHQDLGDPKPSLELGQSAWELIQNSPTASPEQRIKVLLNYADALKANSRFEEALQLFQQAKSLSSASDPAILCSEVWFRTGLAHQDNFANGEALEDFDAALACVDPQDTLQTYKIIGAKALSLNNMGEYSKAKPLFEETLAFFENKLGPNHPNTIEVLNNFASTLDSLGDLEGAEEAIRKCIRATANTLGEEHPSISFMWNNLGVISGHRENYEQAIAAHLKAYQIRIKHHGENHMNSLVSMVNLGYTYDSMNEFQKAEPYYLKAIEVAKNVLGPDHPEVGYIYNNYAYNLKGQGRLSASVAAARRACDIFAKDESQVLEYRMSLSLLAGALILTGETEEAFAKANQVVQLCEGQDDMKNVLIGALTNRGLIYQKRGDREHARADFSRAGDYLLELFGPDNERLKKIQQYLAELGPPP